LSEAIAKPIPVADQRDEGFWRAAARGELAIQRCQACGWYCHPPTTVCSQCFSMPPSFAFEAVSGRGSIVSWTTFRQTFLPGFRDDVPYVIALVELAEQPGLTLIGRLVDGADAPFAIGSAVEVVFDETTPGVAVPAFTLVDERS
jgi:uncharacterized OB-fold protein